MNTSSAETLISYNRCITESTNLPILNLSDPTMASRFEYSTSQSALAFVVYPCICMFGVVVNSIFLLAVIRVPRMRTVINVYLSNLAASDIVFLLTGSMFGLWKYLSTPVTSDYSILGGPAGCFFTQQVNATPLYASTLLVTIVTIERYMAICQPVRHRHISTRRRTAILVGTAWFMAVILSSLLFPASRVYNVRCVIWPDGEYYVDFPSAIAYCFAPDRWAHALVSFTVTVPFVAATVVNLVLYYLIVRQLGRRDNKQSGTSKRFRQVRDRVARMLVVAGVVFFLLITPRVIVSIYYYVVFFGGARGLPPDTEYVLFTATNILLYVNAVTNPIIYGFSNGRYREAFRDAFRVSSCRCAAVEKRIASLGEDIGQSNITKDCTELTEVKTVS